MSSFFSPLSFVPSAPSFPPFISFYCKFCTIELYSQTLKECSSLRQVVILPAGAQELTAGNPPVSTFLELRLLRLVSLLVVPSLLPKSLTFCLVLFFPFSQILQTADGSWALWEGAELVSSFMRLSFMGRGGCSVCRT